MKRTHVTVVTVFVFAVALTFCTDARTLTSPLSATSPSDVPEPAPRALVPAANATSIQPTSKDIISFDLRAAIQSAGDVSGASALFDSVSGRPLAFTTTMDGAPLIGSATHALRFDWAGSRTCAVQTIRLVKNLTGTHPKEIYVSWRQHLGRTLFGGGNGLPDTFSPVNDACGDAGRRLVSIARDGSGGTVDLRWPGSINGGSPTINVTSGSGSVDYAPNEGDWTPSDHVAENIAQTLYMKAESAPGASDGEVAFYVNGRRITWWHDLPIGTQAVSRVAMPTTFAGPPASQSEYVWDVVAWSPPAPPPPPPPVAVASVTVSPDNASVQAGQDRQYSAVTRDASGNVLTGRTVTWASSNTSIATVSSSGLVHGVAPGNASITATSEGKSDGATVTVTQVPPPPTEDTTTHVGSVTVTPDTATLQVSETKQFTATTRDTAGNTLTGRQITWVSSNANVATVSSSGLVRAVAAGAAIVSATSEGQSDSARVTVAQPQQQVAAVTITPSNDSVLPGQTTQLSARATDASGNTVSGVTFTWSSSNTSAATVSSSGLVTGKAAGTATITATGGGKSGTSSITVLSPNQQVASISVSAPSTTVQAGSTMQATATARDASGNTVNGVTFTWASSNPAAATVSSSGLITGQAEGSTTISASANGKSGALGISVSPAPPPPPPPSGSVADPMQLPVAQVNHAMNVSAYNNLHVPQMAAGQTYRDPVTNVRITKLTSASFPASASSWGHDYFEGGSEVSDPYNGDGVTRAVLTMNANGGHYLLDVVPGSGVSQPRALSGNLNPNQDLAFTFSINPNTPYYAYVVNGTTLRRMDIRTMTEVTGNGFPLSGVGSAIWLQVCANDAEFAWMSGSTIHHYTPATGRHITINDGNVNEPRFDRGCRYVGFTMDSPGNGLKMWDTQTNTITWTADGSIPFAHQASLQHMWITSNWNASWPYEFVSVTPTPNSFKIEWGPSVGDEVNGSGQWMQSGDQRAAWTAWNSSGSLSGCNANGSFCNMNWTAPGGIVLVTMTGERRLLGHPYSNQTLGGGYWDRAWPKFSSDGKVVLFTSDMMTGRYDLFLAELPIR